MATRWLIEGEWSGYRSSQQRIVHREVTTSQSRADRLMAQYGITFTDGTVLYFHVRPIHKGERVKGLKNSYGSLIDECLRKDIWTVAGLQADRNTEVPV